MRCMECERQAVALCRHCLVAQCDMHLAQSRRWQSRSAALAGCTHLDAPISNAGAPASRSA